MKKVLFCASTVSHINNFHLPYLKAFKEMGYEVHVAANASVSIKWADKVFALSFDKKFISVKNLRAIVQSYKLIRNYRYERLSTNATLAGIVMRVATMFLKERPRIFHIAHGYLFNLNSGLRKYLYLLPEKIVSYLTDTVMVMNNEDYEIARKYHLYRNNLYYINGMGVNPSRFISVSLEEKIRLKNSRGFDPNDFLFVYAAEFSKRKNQRLLINSFARCNFERAHLILAGDGKKLRECEQLVNQLGIGDFVHFPGYVNDVPDLYAACDAVVSPSLIEGLPFNIIEAMGCRLPVLVSDIKGHRELVEQDRNGFLFQSQNERELIDCLKRIYHSNQEQRTIYGQIGYEKAKGYLLDHVYDHIMNIYKS